MQVKLIAKTVICEPSLLESLNGDNSPEALIMYTARVSSSNQTTNNPGLLRYCMKHKHWSIYQQADFTFEIITSKAISAQILRHRSFHFQEFSARYSEVSSYEEYEARRQDEKNRQNSIDDMSEETKSWFSAAQKELNETAQTLYKEALEKGIAKEQARFLLSQGATTKMYMKGTLRDFIHYIDTRTHPSTQKEHRDIAEEMKKILVKEVPIVAEAAGWGSDRTN